MPLYRATKIETTEIWIEDGDLAAALSDIRAKLQDGPTLTSEIVISQIADEWKDFPIRPTNVEAAFLTTFIKPDDADKTRAVSRQDIASVGMSVFEMSALVQMGCAEPELNADGHMIGRYSITERGTALALKIAETEAVKNLQDDGS